MRLCDVEGCERVHRARGMCNTHYERWRAGHQPRPEGRGNGLTWNGYRRLYVPGRGNLKEHRWIMEQQLGRRLLPHENVHHLNGDRVDNRPENLELWSRSQPAGQRVVDKVAWAKEILAQYAPETLA